MGIEFRIMGPLEVRVDGEPLAVGGPRQRALLAMLLLSANQVVSRDRLIDELLEGAERANVEHMLRVQVSRLRAALSPRGLGNERLIARPPGYLLQVEPGELDLEVFQGLLAEGHAALEEEEFDRAATSLRAAAALWRGRPLADLEFERFARIEIDRLEELRLVAQEDLTDAELELGRHAMLVPELEARVAEHPLRERSRAQLMLALYRCGRQADALQTYRSGRSLLSEELALEPGPALRKLEGSILRQEATLDLTPRLPEPSVAAMAATESAQTGGMEIPTSGRSRRCRRRGTLGLALGCVLILAAAIALLASGGASRSSAGPNTIAVLDPSGTLQAVIPAGGPPGGITTGLGAVWETDTSDDLLLQINPVGREVERIPVGRGPTGVAVGDGEVWVADQLDRTVSEINPHTLATVASFPVGNGAGAVAFGHGSLWVANVTDDTVTRIRAATGRETTIPLAGPAGGIAVGAQGVWVTGESTGQLLLIDPGTDQVTQAVQIGNQPTGVAVGAGKVWVADTADGTVSRFDPGTGGVAKVNVGRGPAGVVFGAGGLWVANTLDASVARIAPKADTARLVHVGGAPTALATSGERLFATVLPSPMVHRGGTLRVDEGPLFGSIGNSLDPATFAGFSQWQMLSLTNDGLVTYRRAGGLAGGVLVADLATSLPSPTDGGRTYTFRMRSGIRYSTGAPVRPADIRHEFERIFRIGNGYAQSFYTGLVGARACMEAPKRCTLSGGVVANKSANTVTFHLTAPDPDFLYKLAFPWADAIPSTTPYRDLRRSEPPATGPYMTKSISPSRQPGPAGHGPAFHTWVLVRNPRFRPWQREAQPPGYPDRIVLRNDESPQQAATEVAQNRLDVLVPVPRGRLAAFAVHYAQRFHSEPIGATLGLALNTRAAPFNHLAVRRAVNYAIDRSRIAGFVGGRLAARPTCQILPPNIPGYQPFCPYTRGPGPGGTWQAPDLAKAERLVAASGTRGMKVTILLEPPNDTDLTAPVGPYLARVLRRLGYRVSLRVTQQIYSIMPNSRSGAQIGWFGWYQDYPAPSDFITNLLTCKAFTPDTPNNMNEAEFCDRRIDAEIRRTGALQAVAPGQASQQWNRIDRAITAQAPWLPLFNPRLDIATSARVGNYQYHPFWALLLDQLWVR